MPINSISSVHKAGLKFAWETEEWDYPDHYDDGPRILNRHQEYRLQLRLEAKQRKCTRKSCKRHGCDCQDH